MRHGWSIRLAGLAPAGLVAACLAAPAPDESPLPLQALPSSGAISAEAAGEHQGHGPTSAPTAAGSPTAEETTEAVDWTGDCLAQLRRLERAAREGRLTVDDRPPIAVVLVSDSQGWLEAPPRQPVDADLPLEVYDDAPPPAAPCMVQIGPAQGQTSAYRAIDLHDVDSVYQSGVRRERNPEYDVAERKLRQAKHDARGEHKIISVGDPLLDLIGLAVGGVINAFDSRSSSNRIEEAAAELASLPRSREEPVYRPYNFERYVVRAQKQAVVPVALLDAAGRTLRSTDLRQREMREFFMLQGLDPRDRDYEQHRTSSMTPAELARWQRTPPALRLSSVAAALIDGGSHGDAFAGAPAAAPVAPSVAPLGPDLDDLPEADRTRDPGRGLEAPELEVEWQTVELEDAALVAPAMAPPGDPPGGPPSRPVHADLGVAPHEPLPDDWLRRQDLTTMLAASAQGVGEPGRQGFDLADLKSGVEVSWDAGRTAPAATGPHASVVRIKAGFGPDAGGGSGFYVREDLVLTAYDVVRDASVVDVTLADGATVPALVASVDPTQGLALVQVPRPGPVVALYPGNDPPPERTAGASADGSGRPVFLDDQVVGMTTRAAGDRTGVVAIGAIRTFLDARTKELPVLP